MSPAISVRSRLAVPEPFYTMANPFGDGMLKGFGERFIVTERRRAIVHGVGDALRPKSFIQTAALNAQPSRRSMVSKLRKMERKVIIFQAIRDFFTGWLPPLYRLNPLYSYADQVRTFSR